MTQLCTAAQVKDRLGITHADHDAMIGEVVTQVSDEIEQFVGLLGLVPANAATLYFDTTQGHTLYVPRGIRTVTSLSIAATDQPDDGSGTYAAIAATRVIVRPVAAERRAGWPGTEIRVIGTTIPFSTAANGAKVVGDFGFSATPAVVTRIAITASVAEYLDRKRAGQSGPEGVELPRLLEDTDLAALARFRVGLGFA